MFDHADLAEREGHEHPHDVEVDQRGHLRLECDDERDGAERQEQDAVGERQPVTAGVQLPRQETVLRQDRPQDRETVECGVGRQHQDQRGHTGDQVQPRREVVEHRRRQLGDERLLLVVLRCSLELFQRPLGDLHAGVLGQQDHAHEQRDRDGSQ